MAEEMDVIEALVEVIEKINETMETLVRAAHVQQEIADALTKRIERLESFDVLLSRN